MIAGETKKGPRQLAIESLPRPFLTKVLVSDSSLLKMAPAARRDFCTRQWNASSMMRESKSISRNTAGGKIPKDDQSY